LCGRMENPEKKGKKEMMKKTTQGTGNAAFPGCLATTCGERKRERSASHSTGFNREEHQSEEGQEQGEEETFSPLFLPSFIRPSSIARRFAFFP